MRILISIRTFMAGLVLASCATDDVGGATRLIDANANTRVYDQVTRTPARLTVWNAALADPSKAERLLEGSYRTDGIPAKPPPLLEETVARVKARLEPHLPGGKYPFPVVVEDCAQVHAYVDPTGALRICRTALSNAASEDEIAFMVAHEMGHVVMGHSRVHESARTMQTAGMLAGVLLDAIAESDNNKDNRRALKLGADALYTYPTKFGAWMKNSFMPDQETASDMFAVDLLEKAGYNPFLGAAALRTYSISRPDAPTAPVTPGFVRFLQAVDPNTVPPVRTHPDLQDRQTRLQDYIAAHVSDEAADRPRLTLPWADENLITTNRVSETIQYFAAYEAADIAINHTVKARRAMNSSAPNKMQIATQHCDAAIHNINSALRSRAATDRDIRKRALTIGYYCGDIPAGSQAILALDGTPQAGTWIYKDLLTMAMLQDNVGFGREVIDRMVARHGRMTTFNELLRPAVTARSSLAGYIVSLCEDDYRQKYYRENMSSDARNTYSTNLQATCHKPRSDLQEAIDAVNSDRDSDSMRYGLAFSTISYLQEVRELSQSNEDLNIGQSASKPWQQAFTQAFGPVDMSTAAADMAAGRLAARKQASTRVDLNLRNRPAPEGGAVVMTIPQGQSIWVLGPAPRSSGWVQVLFGNTIGYVSDQYLQYESR